MRTVIAYDISDDRTRYHLARVLEDYAVRVQKSVFESPEMSRATYLRLRSRIEGIFDPETDCLRYYRLCRACSRRIEHEGIGPAHLPAPGPFQII